MKTTINTISPELIFEFSYLQPVYTMQKSKYILATSMFSPRIEYKYKLRAV